MNPTTTPSTFSFGAWWARRRDERQRLASGKRCPPATVAVEQIPAGIRAAWAQQAPAEFPGLAVDERGWRHGALGLAQFFEACRLQHGQGPCALPSKAADSVWHVWLQVDAAGLAAWQQRFFGREVPHREAAELGAPLEDCLARTWVGACRSEGLSPLGPRLPLVFAVDGLLGLPTGWAYQHRGGVLSHQQIDGFGSPGGSAYVHAGMAAGGLLALGLVSDEELAALRRAQGDGATGSGFVADGSSCDSGSASCDGGGSGCGGSGCGGGGGS
ncbi:hypothetical protein [Roseateles asaccharophilus]|uniref:Uncharacterized protein n=1 Tax=Roseateles asaccharophilus TaxID=582607 RepID=A0ABU2A4Z5_9BURK|nr:hypothetical protein [Roseateles asaccharophilus]MDR7332272.1 hypothetical protein [Roseateles asaccharophilus]